MENTQAQGLGPVYHHRNTMALLNLLGFSDVREGRDGFTLFRLLEDRFDIIRYDREICLEILIPSETSLEVYGYGIGLKDLILDYPKLQGFYSLEDDVFRLRTWLPYPDSDQLGAAVREGIELLTSARHRMEEIMLDGIYDVYTKPLFARALAINRNEDDDD